MNKSRLIGLLVISGIILVLMQFQLIVTCIKENDANTFIKEDDANTFIKEEDANTFIKEDNANTSDTGNSTVAAEGFPQYNRKEDIEVPWGPSPIWAVWKHPKERPLTIFECGWRGNADITRQIFPEFTRYEVLTHAKSPPNATEYDLILYGKHGPCPGLIRKWIVDEFEGKSFNGKTLYVNGEKEHANAEIRNDRIYTIGPLADSTRSIRVFWGTIILWRRRDLQNLIFNHTMKPKNTQKRFLVYTAGRCVDFREMAFHNLSLISTVDYAGKCQGITNSTTNKRPAIKNPKTSGWSTNYYLFNDYRFCIVMENTYHDGYITEKIINAYMGGCVPIFYGTTEVFDLFNKDSFVYYNIHDPLPALLRIAHLELNKTAYEEVQDQPILANGERTIKDYFSYRDDIGEGNLKYRIREMMGLGKR